MLPKKNRLTKKKDFKKVYQEGKNVFLKNGCIAVKVAKNNESDTRAGFLVGKRFSRKSVHRNKMKRVLREIFHQHLKNIRPGFDVVVSCKNNNQGKKQVDYAEISNQLKKLLEKSKLLKK